MDRIAGLDLSNSKITVGLILVISIAALVVIRQTSQAAHPVINSHQSAQSVNSNAVVNDSFSSASVGTEPASGASQDNQSASNTKVTVNGQDIAVPDNGEVHQTISDGNTTTTIDAQASSSSSASAGQASNSNSSSLNVNVNSSSRTSQ